MSLSTLWEPHFQAKLLTLAGKWVTTKHQRKALEASQIWLHKSSFVFKNQECVLSFGSCNKVQCGQVGITKSTHRFWYLSKWSADAEGEKHNELLSRDSFAETSQAWFPSTFTLHTVTTTQIWSFLHMAEARGSGRLNWAIDVTAAQHHDKIAQQSPNPGHCVGWEGKVQEGLSFP